MLGKRDNNNNNNQALLGLCQGQLCYYYWTVLLFVASGDFFFLRIVLLMYNCQSIDPKTRVCVCVLPCADKDKYLKGKRCQETTSSSSGPIQSEAVQYVE